jgi:hypothetical protein
MFVHQKKYIKMLDRNSWNFHQHLVAIHHRRRISVVFFKFSNVCDEEEKETSLHLHHHRHRVLLFDSKTKQYFLCE